MIIIKEKCIYAIYIVVMLLIDFNVKNNVIIKMIIYLLEVYI